jgi:hypothetical protein
MPSEAPVAARLPTQLDRLVARSVIVGFAASVVYDDARNLNVSWDDKRMSSTAAESDRPLRAERLQDGLNHERGGEHPGEGSRYPASCSGDSRWMLAGG